MFQAIQYQNLLCFFSLDLLSCYLLGFANILLQIDRNCMILSSKCRSSSPLNKYMYLKETIKDISRYE